MINWKYKLINLKDNRLKNYYFVFLSPISCKPNLTHASCAASAQWMRIEHLLTLHLVSRPHVRLLLPLQVWINVLANAQCHRDMSSLPSIKCNHRRQRALLTTSVMLIIIKSCAGAAHGMMMMMTSVSIFKIAKYTRCDQLLVMQVFACAHSTSAHRWSFHLETNEVGCARHFAWRGGNTPDEIG